MVVLDTCAIIEACQPNPDFSARTAKKMAAGFYVLSISFAEIACKVKLGKLKMSISPKILYMEYCQVKNLKMVDIGVEEWLDSIDLDSPDNKDPADRVITAFGIKKQIPIVTNDQKIKNFYENVIW